MLPVQVPVKPVKFSDPTTAPDVNVKEYVPVVKLKLNALFTVPPVVFAVTVVAVAVLLLMFTVGVPV